MIDSQPRRTTNTLPNRLPPPPKQRGVTAFVLFYSVIILAIAGWSGFLGYNWARQRVLGAEDFPSLQAASGTSNDPANPQAQDNANVSIGNPSTSDSETADLAPISVLLMGSDERPQDDGTVNTDTIILLTLNPQTKQAGMLSFSRDMWISVPWLGDKAKINTIYGIGERSGYQGGGAQLLMDTISSMIGQPIQHYVRINFDGFVQTVDLIGGIDINLPRAIHDEEYPTANFGVETFHLNAGSQHLDGRTALKYARTRHVDDDYGRQRRQQDVIRAVFDRVRSQGITTLLGNLTSMLGTLGKSVDTNLWGELPKMYAYANFLSRTDLQGIQQEVIDKRYGQEDFNSYGQWILIPTPSEVRVAVNRFFGKVNTIASDSAQTDISWVRVEVLNGAGVIGVAARTRELLRQRGWNVVSINDADRDDYTQTIVVNYGAPEAIVKRMTADLQMQPNLNSLSGLARNAPIDVKIVVGKDLLPQLGIVEE